ncbi:MAG: molybdopterin-synthase adenylyltransferase MoeB [Alphaproteobacteria bacterium]|nr:molybdopterin-synthase adenylyltransferase MoeB [Alphaproteobacteria bacterium]
MDLREDQIHRYARHIILQEVGGVGQATLLASRVLVIGAGGLGSPVLLYLAAAGIGTLGVIDDDRVDLSNLQRQVLHTTDRVGTPKVDSAAAALTALNPDVKIERHAARLTADNAAELVSRYDIVADGSDNFATRYLVNDACFFAKKTLVSAAILQFDGQLTTFKAHEAGERNPCYRCLFASPPAADATATCSSAGVLGALAGTLGALQATEVIKETLGIGQSLSGELVLYDALSVTFRKLKFKRRADCALCGTQPSITGLTGRAA